MSSMKICARHEQAFELACPYCDDDDGGVATTKRMWPEGTAEHVEAGFKRLLGLDAPPVKLESGRLCECEWCKTMALKTTHESAGFSL